MIASLSTWRIEDGAVVELTPPRPRPTVNVRNAALVRALAALGEVTYCKLGSRPSRGVVHWSAFRVLERWGLAMRSIDSYVAITEAGRAALARCQTRVQGSRMEVSPTT